MHLDDWSLREPAGRATRRAALELLARMRENRDRLGASSDPEALHDFRVSVRRLRSWLRAFAPVFEDTLSPKAAERLKRIAAATGSSRDLEVHLKWVGERRHSLRGEQRRGADWLIDHLTRRKAACDLELKKTVDAEFDRSVKRVDAAMSRYTASVTDAEPRFAAVSARLVRRHASALSKALKSVLGIGDRAQAHEARIAAKRLRYLLAPLDHALPDASAVVAELGDLQDRLGELHDAQLFGSEIATAVAGLLSDRAMGKPESSRRRRATDVDTGESDDPVPGLVAVARRLRRAEETAYEAARSGWLADGASALLGRVSAMADDLDRIAREGREIERVYLLRGMPADLPSAAVVEIDEGFVPGERIDERVRREQGGEGEAVSHYRTFRAGTGVDAVALDEATGKPVFAGLWPLTRGNRLCLRRHRVEGDLAWDVLEFRDRELVLAVVRMDHDDTVPTIPEWLEPAIDRDVTDDESYARRRLAR